jgi:hypothetical protein
MDGCPLYFDYAGFDKLWMGVRYIIRYIKQYAALHSGFFQTLGHPYALAVG